MHACVPFVFNISILNLQNAKVEEPCITYVCTE